MAFVFWSFTIWAYTITCLRLWWPRQFATISIPSPLRSARVENVCLDIWKDSFFVIPAFSAAVFRLLFTVAVAPLIALSLDTGSSSFLRLLMTGKISASPELQAGRYFSRISLALSGRGVSICTPVLAGPLY